MMWMEKDRKAVKGIIPLLVYTNIYIYFPDISANLNRKEVYSERTP